MSIVWTDYLRYRARLRGFDLTAVEMVVRYSSERYLDRGTGRMVVVGKAADSLVVVPYDQRGDDLVPVTLHPTTRQQVNARLRAGRYERV